MGKRGRKGTKGKDKLGGNMIYKEEKRGGCPEVGIMTSVSSFRLCWVSLGLGCVGIQKREGR